MNQPGFMLLRRPFARELLIFICFCALTAVMTWPWILHLHDAVADKGDPYMIAWTLWWDFHQTFHNPLHLFDANVFYPYRYTLAFSENDYGIAMLFFPLFALGLRPLTVHAIATFFGFAFSGYGAFRLTRTLSGDYKAAWLAGIIFAFIPYRFHLLSHLHYLFAGWLPLVCEALILFARQTSWKRAAWLGVAFLMNALTCISWFIMALVPLGLTFVFLLFTTQALARSRVFWIRGATALAGAMLLLSPFLITYYRVSVLYGLHWQPWEFAFNSALPINWLKSDSRNKLWQNLGTWIPSGNMLFPGVLAPLLALAALRFRHAAQTSFSRLQRYARAGLDIVIALAFIVAVVTVLYQDLIIRILGVRIIRLNPHSIRHALIVIVVATAARVVLTLPSIVQSIRSSVDSADCVTRWREHSAIVIGFIWMAWGFLSSLGPNFFIYRWLLNYVVLFQSIRFPSRAAMICFVGLAVLGGVGGAHIASRVQRALSFKHLETVGIILIAGMLMFELRAAPLHIERGEVEPSALALRLRKTPMTGGIVELPSVTDQARHFYMLRAADHQRPLVNATSSFVSPTTDQINKATEGKIDSSLMDLLEQIPTSYLVIHNSRMTGSQQIICERFLARHTTSGRLRFVNRFEPDDDLYAIVKNEPTAISEAPLPIKTTSRDWHTELERDPVSLLALPEQSLTLYRILLTTTGAMPKYSDFMRDLKAVAAYVNLNSDEATTEFTQNLSEFSARLMEHESMQRLDNRTYVAHLVRNTNVPFYDWEQEQLAAQLDAGQQSRVDVLLKIANDDRLIEMQKDRSLLVLHYFAFLRRNPNDPPDRNFSGFNFWLQQLTQNHDTQKIATAFQNSIEFQAIKQRQH